MVEKELTPYLKETRYAHLIKCFLDPNDMIRGAEVPNSLRDDELAYEEGPNGDIQPAMRGGELSDLLYELFIPTSEQQGISFCC